jgi:flagellar operon protein
MSYRLINRAAYSLEDFKQVDSTQNNKNKNGSINKSNNINSFKAVLNGVLNQEKNFIVSKHAALRLNEINFTEDDMRIIEKGFEIAKEKNSRNTVMIYKDVALIASVENRTIITAIEKERAKDNIFTNIDSVVIL